MAESSTPTQALKDAGHDLEKLHGRYVSDSPHHEESWRIDTTKIVNKIEQALVVCERSLSERIGAAYDEAIEAKKQMQKHAFAISEAEEAAKNNDTRPAIILRALALDEDYQRRQRLYRNARDAYRLYLLEIERLKLLVELRKAGGGAV